MDTTTLILLTFISLVVIVGLGGFIWAVNKKD
jgi:nitrogen fixation-related uncharacterized protein